jgi:Ca-activated chloride channel family protein
LCMFDLQVAWDRPAHAAVSNGEHVLRVRIVARPLAGGSSGLPLRLAIALDTSGSMEGEKLDRAKCAVSSVIALLRPEDKLWLASFATGVRPVLDGIPGGPDAKHRGESAVSGLVADGVTRTDSALDWIGRVLPVEQGTVRAGILVTDGHPTDPRGGVLTEVGALISQAAALARRGVAVSTAGLGSAADFNSDFLINLCDRGGGSFLFADSPAALESRLRGQLLNAQKAATAQGVLLLKTLGADAKVRAVCRIRPEYTPMDVSSKVQLGVLRADQPTDFLVAVSLPAAGFGGELGSRAVLGVRLESGTYSTEQQAAIEYTNTFARVQQVNREVDRDRILWELNTYAADLAKSNNGPATVRLLENISATARQLGKDDITKQADKALSAARASGKVAADPVTKLRESARRAGETT